MYEIKIPFTHCGNGIFFCEKLKKVQFAMYICEKVCYNKYIKEAKPFFGFAAGCIYCDGVKQC